MSNLMVTVINGVGNDSGSFTAIPYYAWDNREPGSMDVWIKEKV